MSRWVVVPNWHRFQHYGMARRPPWIKNYTALLHDDDYLDLTLASRGLLHGIWLAYADRRGHLREGPDLSSTLQAKVLEKTLAPLNHAGLVEFSASKPLDLDLKPSNTRAGENPKPPGSRQKAAENWIRNGAASEVPADHLAEVFADEFKITDPELVQELVERAKRCRP